MRKKLTRIIIILAFWVALFYSLLLGVHLLCDHFLGTQEFYEALTRGSRRLLFQQVIEGWIYTLWMAVFLATLSLIRTPKNWPQIYAILLTLLPGALFLISVKFVFSVSFLQILPIIFSFSLIASVQFVFFRS